MIGLSRCKFPVLRTSDGTPIEVLRDIEFASTTQCIDSAPGREGYQFGRGIPDPDDINFITCTLPWIIASCLTQ